MTEAEKVIKAVRIQTDRPIPDLPERWTGEEQWGYIKGWEDAMMHIEEAIATYDAGDYLEELNEKAKAWGKKFES